MKWYSFCYKIQDLEQQLENLIHLQQLAAVTEHSEYQLMLSEAGMVSLEVTMATYVLVTMECYRVSSVTYEQYRRR